MAANGDDISSASLMNIVTEKSDAFEIDDSNVVDLPTANDSQVFAAPKITPAETYEVGDLLVSYLDYIGVEYVFGIPGGRSNLCTMLCLAVQKEVDRRAVVARHETGAAFMADGYARNSGNLGVCCATAGPGATNLITGVASAYDNHSPLLSNYCTDSS